MISRMSMIHCTKRIFHPHRYKLYQIRPFSVSSVSKQTKLYDVVISGAGMIGGAMAAALANMPMFADKSILLLDAAPRKSSSGVSDRYSSRTVALSPATKSLLEGFGAWEGIEKMRFQPITRMQIWDSCSPGMITFQNEDMLEPLAYVVENDILQAAIDDIIDSTTNVTRYNNALVSQYRMPNKEFQEEESPWVRITLASEENIETRLVIGADGVNSKLRTDNNIHTKKLNYDQMGVVAVLKLGESTENNVAWQRFLTTGPIAMLPLTTDISCLIWSTLKDDAQNLLRLEPSSFVDAVNNAFWSDSSIDPMANYVGTVLDNALTSVGLEGSTSRQLPPTVLDIEASSRAAFPFGCAHASRYVAHRMALIGDAAHRVHPLAGQGANIGFSDVSKLCKHLSDAVHAGADIGSMYHLAAYETESQRHNIPVMAGIDGISRLYSTKWSPIITLRTIGLQTTNAITPLKDLFMKQAQSFT